MRDERPKTVEPWFDEEIPTRRCTFAPPPRNRMYHRGIIPPWLCPTRSTCVDPGYRASTASTPAESSPALRRTSARPGMPKRMP